MFHTFIGHEFMFITGDLPSNALVINFFTFSDFSAKLQKIRMLFILLCIGNYPLLQTKIESSPQHQLT